MKNGVWFKQKIINKMKKLIINLYNKMGISDSEIK
jgi:hypothetical protein